MKTKELLKEMWFCPEIMLKEIGLKFIPIYLASLIIIPLLHISLFDWIGLNPLFFFPTAVIHFYTFMYYGLYKEHKKSK